MSPPLFYLGLDIGSTTVKLALLTTDGAIAETRYCRHGTAVRTTLASLLAEVSQLYPHATVRCAMTGSGALDLSNQLSILFVQELLATARAIAHCAPDTSVAVELGGEGPVCALGTLYFSGDVRKAFAELVKG